MPPQEATPVPGWFLAQDPGTQDGGDGAALVPKASDSWPVLAHFNGENVPRAWEFLPVSFTKAFWTRSSEWGGRGGSGPTGAFSKPW